MPLALLNVENKMKKNGFAPLIIILVIAIFGMVLYFGYKDYLSRQQSTYVGNYADDVDVKFPTGSQCASNYDPQDKCNSKTLDTDAQINACLAANPIITHCRGDLYLRDKTTGKETYALTSEDILPPQFGGMTQYRNGNILFIKRVGNDTGDSTNWIDQLWNYTSPTKGKDIFLTKGLVFRASQSGNLIAIPVNSNKLNFIDRSGKIVKQFSLSDLQISSNSDYPGGVSVDALTNSGKNWSRDGNFFWGTIGAAADIYNFFEIDVQNWKIYKYTPPLGDFGQNEMDLDVNTGKIVYSDFPLFFDETSYQDFVDTKKLVTLYAYDLKTGQKITVATSSAKQFRPKWLDDNTIEYTDPKGSGLLMYSIK